MIIKEELYWRNISIVVRGGPLPSVWLRLLLVFSYSVGVVYLYERLSWGKFSIPTFPFTVIGFALAIFFAFRNNAAYDRYWEARKHWGNLYNACRHLTVQVITLVPAISIKNEKEQIEEIEKGRYDVAKLLISYVYSLKNLLRKQGNENLSQYLPEGEFDKIVIPEINAPTQILLNIGLRLQKFSKRGWCEPVNLNVIQENLFRITKIQGACERIKTTPVPFVYKRVIETTAILYCYCLPIALVPGAGRLTPLIIALIAYVFLSFEHIGDEIEDPFGLDPNDLPLNAYAEKIEKAILQQFGEVPEKHGERRKDGKGNRAILI